MIELVALDEIDLIREVHLPVIRPSQGCSWADSKTSKSGVFVHLMVKSCINSAEIHYETEGEARRLQNRLDKEEMVRIGDVNVGSDPSDR